VDSVTPPNWKHIAGAAVLGCVLTLAVLSAFKALSKDPSQPDSATLATKLGPIRLTEGRVDGQILYAGYRTPLEPRERLSVLRGFSPPQAAPSPTALRDRAFYRLLRNDLDGAISDLEEAVGKVYVRAATFSDLSALYGERARTKDRPEDYVNALEMADQAAWIDSSVEIGFNRALALERLYLVDGARKAWDEYIALDPDSPWADEARQHLARLAPAQNQQRGELPVLLMESTTSEDIKTVETLNDKADHLESLGKPGEAWRYRYRALTWSCQRLSRTKVPVALKSLTGVVFASLAQRHPLAALEFQKRAVEIAESFGDPKQIVEALLSKARIELALGIKEPAKRNFSKALVTLHDVRHPSKALAALFDVVQREIEESDDRAATIAMEKQVSGQFGTRADLAFHQGDMSSGEGALRRAMDAIEQDRARVSSRNDRVSFFDQSQPVFMRMVALKLHLARPEEALEILERFRARALLDQVNGDRPADPLGWRDFSRVPAHTTVLVYAVVEDRLVIWIVQPSGISVSRYQPVWDKVAAEIQRLPRTPSGSPTAARLHNLEQLYRYLVAPASRDLHAGDRIIFVPTRSLYSVPFAALRNPDSGRFLVQDHEAGGAPSVSEFLAAVERDRRISAKPIAKVLLVGNPTMDRQAGMQLSPLPGAEEEVASLSRVYHGLDVRVLTRRDATPSRVLDAVGRYEIVHLAVHGQQDREDPTRAHLVLSAAGGEPGELSVKDILRTRLTRTRLVVLAACETQAGPVSESEGSLSLSHAFLAAGAPAVVGSLWRVTDGGTERLSVRFHQELLRGADALSALRTAQLAELSTHPEGSDWTWASFQVFGGVEARTPL
jgi:CHAT domain-containing protein